MSGLGGGLTLGAVLVASLVGSVHCVGMCGGFVTAVCAAPERDERGRLARVAPLLAYQLARGGAYVGLGALAGLFGAGLDASASLVGIQRLAGPLMGVTLIAMGLAALRPAQTGASSGLIRLEARTRRRSGLPRVGEGARELFRRMTLRITAARSRLAGVIAERGVEAGAAAGLLSALLPCGWLWAYVVVAASTGRAGYGALVMLCFWLGSVPALSGVGLVADLLRHRIGRHAPRVTAALMLALGLLALVGKLQLAPPPLAPPADSEHPGETSPAAELPTSAPCH